ncbi:MAG: leucine-rich repeat protein [Clostridia bacterium]|nr:leucine-rich repeat protein [Clostridia bacterium]
MKKLLLLVLSLIMLTCLSFGLTACAGKDGIDGQDGITPTIEISNDGYWVINGTKTEYKAVAENGKDGQNGKDGVSIVDVYVNNDGYLMVKYSNSQTYVNVGKVENNEEQGTYGLKYALNEDGKSLSVDGIGMAFERDIVIPSTYNGLPVTRINTYAFQSCVSIASITIPNTVTSIGNKAFSGCTSLTSAVIPNSVTSIGSSAFYYCTSLTSVVIGDGVTSIGSSAFYSCDSLTSIEIPNSVTSIGEMAFCGCASLTSIVIGDGVTSIGNNAFNSCNSLTSIEIPDSVTSIGNKAFYYCYKLVEVINKSPNITVVKGSSGNGNLGYYALSVSNCNDSYVSRVSIDSNGYVIYNDGVDKILVGYVGTQTSLTLPNNITKINNYAFYNCDSLTSVTIPNSVTSIGYRAFYDCDSLTSVTIGNGVKSIGDYAFNYCTSLTNINVDENNTNYKSIDGNLYSKDGKTLIQYAIGKTQTSFTIPNSVTSIGDYAFYYCESLTSITIGNGVTSIGDYAFYYCTSLTSIKYGGTQSQWQAIIKGYDWNYYTGSYTITYNYTGE